MDDITASTNLHHTSNWMPPPLLRPWLERELSSSLWTGTPSGARSTWVSVWPNTGSGTQSVVVVRNGFRFTAVGMWLSLEWFRGNRNILWWRFEMIRWPYCSLWDFGPCLQQSCPPDRGSCTGCSSLPHPTLWTAEESSHWPSPPLPQKHALS